jgi:hypothetical protein
MADKRQGDARTALFDSFAVGVGGGNVLVVGSDNSIGLQAFDPAGPGRPQPYCRGGKFGTSAGKLTVLAAQQCPN